MMDEHLKDYLAIMEQDAHMKYADEHEDDLPDKIESKAAWCTSNAYTATRWRCRRRSANGSRRTGGQMHRRPSANPLRAAFGSSSSDMI